MKSKVNTNLKKQVSENDVAMAASEPTSTTAEKKFSISPQLKTILATAVAGTITVGSSMAVMKHLEKFYGVRDWKTLSNFFKAALNGKWWTGTWGKVLGGISKAVIHAIEWANKTIMPIVHKLPDYAAAMFSKEKFNTPISSSTERTWYTLWFKTKTTYSQYTYGSVICMTVIASAVALVLYKVVKSLVKKEPIDVRVVNESVMVFKELDMITEKINVRGYYGIYDTSETFIQKMQGKVMDMYNTILKVASANKILTAMVLVCAICIAGWAGMKRFMDEHPEMKFGKSNVAPTMEAFLATHKI